MKKKNQKYLMYAIFLFIALFAIGKLGSYQGAIYTDAQIRDSTNCPSIVPYDSARVYSAGTKIVLREYYAGGIQAENDYVNTIKEYSSNGEYIIFNEKFQDETGTYIRKSISRYSTMKGVCAELPPSNPNENPTVPSCPTVAYTCQQGSIAKIDSNGCFLGCEQAAVTPPTTSPPTTSPPATDGTSSPFSNVSDGNKILLAVLLVMLLFGAFMLKSKKKKRGRR